MCATFIPIYGNKHDNRLLVVNHNVDRSAAMAADRFGITYIRIRGAKLLRDANTNCRFCCKSADDKLLVTGATTTRHFGRTGNVTGLGAQLL